MCIFVGRTREAVRRIKGLRGVVEYGALQASAPYASLFQSLELRMQQGQARLVCKNP